ncbi:MAG: CPBP family intramembrane glutamic endopeptidase [Chitinophagales bacterium]|nr:CPBP family intramembrane metalloprotease [Chitinophagales bacterium]MDW8272856.1 CPBP family intramembrane glutamic endopeptidase [Chitinophagales bacterium]
MFYISAFIIHQYLGVDNAEAFMSNVNLQAQNPSASLVMQALTASFGSFFLPAFMFSVLAYGNFCQAMKLKSLPPSYLMLLSLLLIFLSGVFASLLVDINKSLPLPDSLQFLKEYQKKYELLLDSLFSGITIQRLLALVLVLAVLPALGEEIFFRGVVQKILSESRLGPHGAIFFTSVAFSAMHFEFENSLAIFFMGLMLGYIFYFTQSLWASIAAHFMNNFIQIIFKYLFVSGYIADDYSDPSGVSLYQTAPAGVLSIFVFWLLYKKRVITENSQSTNSIIHHEA